MSQELPKPQHKKWVRVTVQSLLIVAGWWTTLGFLMYSPLYMRLIAISCIVIAVVILLAEGN